MIHISYVKSVQQCFALLCGLCVCCGDVPCVLCKWQTMSVCVCVYCPNFVISTRKLVQHSVFTDDMNHELTLYF